MGTKPKFWYRDEYDAYWLFKCARPETGEDWAEKLACEIAVRMGLPCARVDLAASQEQRGTVSRSFVEADEMLVHGNELMGLVDPHYPRTTRYGASGHTLERIERILALEFVGPPRHWRSPPQVREATDVFVGYLVLDAFIGNTDRHHENWGLVIRGDERDSGRLVAWLAPTFDHASSLGRELQDERRLAILNRRGVGRYVEKCRSAIFLQEKDRRPLGSVDLVRAAAAQAPKAVAGWLDAVGDVSDGQIEEMLSSVPQDRMSNPARRFVSEFLAVTRAGLATVRKEMAQ